jgi:hypothetical protein
MSMQNQTVKGRFRGLGLAVAAVFVAGILGLVAVNLPKGFDMDLTKIGTGKPAIVFVYDNNLTISGVQTGEMNNMRDGFGDRLIFLVADIGRPMAREWILKNQAHTAELLFFDAQGNLQHRQPAPLTAEQLIDTVRITLGAE